MFTNLSARRSLPLTAALALVAACATAEPASAADHRVLFNGLGAYDQAGDGVAVTGTATGKPFDGTYAGRLAADDGELPGPGACEQGAATLHLDGPKDRFLELDATGEICGRWTDSSSRVTHVFTGRYLVADSSSRRFTGTDGFFEVRLADVGTASVFAIDT